MVKVKEHNICKLRYTFKFVVGILFIIISIFQTKNRSFQRLETMSSKLNLNKTQQCLQDLDLFIKHLICTYYMPN